MGVLGSRPERIVLATLVGIALLLFAEVRALPEYVPGRPTTAPAASGPPVQDFAYHFNYARGAAAEPDLSPYSVAAHRRFLTGWLGAHVTSALCFAYTPTLVLLLAPLFPLPTAWAWLVWNAAGAWLAVRGVRTAAGDDRRLAAYACLALASPTVFYCFALGQTALVTTGLLALLTVFTSREGAPKARWAAAACLFALTMKPPLAAVGGAALLAAAAWRPLALALAPTVATVAAAIAWWDVALLEDYRTLIAGYDLVNADPLFRMGFHPEVMSNLRNVLLRTGWFDDGQAARLTWYPFVASLALPAMVAVARRRPVSVELAAAWTAVGYLLFSPHLSPTEDLLLVPVMLWLWPAAGARERRVLASLCVGLQFAGASSAALMLRLDLAPAAAVVVPPLVFGSKLAVAAVAARALATPLSSPSVGREPAYA